MGLDVIVLIVCVAVVITTTVICEIKINKLGLMGYDEYITNPSRIDNVVQKTTL